MLIRKQIDQLLRRFEKDFDVHNRIEVSRAAILHNLDLFARLSDKQVIPVLKGNAYGHGIQAVARILNGCGLPYIAVDGYFEALRVREVSRQPVLIMGAIKPENYKHIKYDNFAFVVDNETAIHCLGKTRKRIKVHLECNTGMNRYGSKPDNVVELAGLIQSYKNLELEGLMTHLADSDGVDPVTADTAVGKFDTCVEQIHALGIYPPLLHVAQSAGSVRQNPITPTQFV